MTDFYPSQSTEPQPSGLLQTKVSVKTILLAIALAVLLLIGVLIMVSSFGKAEPVAGQVINAINPDDKTFKYDGQVYLDGKQYNVSLTVQGLSSTDAFNIAKKYIGG
jgi:hypothetical protein